MKVIVHASVFMSGAFEIDTDTKKVAAIVEPEFGQGAMVIPREGELTSISQVALVEMAVMNLIKQYLKSDAKTTMPTMPPAEGVQ